jgi:hypothetical protein
MNGLDQIILANRLADKAHAANNARNRRNLAGERAAAKHATSRVLVNAVAKITDGDRHPNGTFVAKPAPRTKSGRITEINP